MFCMLALTICGASAQETVVFYESFNKCPGTGGNGPWNGPVARHELKEAHFDNPGWKYTNGNAASKCVKLGKGSAKGSATTPAIDLDGTATLTFKAGAWDQGTEGTTLVVKMTGGTLSENAVTMVKGKFTEYTLTITGGTAGAKITFSAKTADHNRFFLDEVKVTLAGGSAEEIAIPAIATSEGYATYFTDKAFIMPEGLEATTVSNDGESNSLSMPWQYQPGNTVPAATALLVKGTKGESYRATVVSSAEKAPEDNALFGSIDTETPTEEGKYYKLTYSNEEGRAVLGFFYDNETGSAFESAGGKAYLRLPADVSAAAAKGFAIDGDVTGVGSVKSSQTVDSTVIYNLNGHRLLTPVKGVNIIGGKKVLVK